MKKILILALTMLLLSSFLVSHGAALFYDVDYQTDGGKAIHTLSEKGIIAGYGNGFFGPEDTLTRAQAVKIINGVFGYENKSEITFTDVAEDAWYYNDVAIAVEAGYIKGYGNGLFGPDDTLTREQVCVMLDNIMNFTLLPVEVTVNDAISEWAKDSVMKMLSNYLAVTDENGNFRATEEITREETCAILVQFVLADPPEIPVFDLAAVEREELEGRLSRVILGIRGDLTNRTEIPEIKALFEGIAVNMENYLANPEYDYKTASKEMKATYSRMKKEYRKEAKNLMVGFFLDEKYMEDLDVLYDFFF